ncbi:TM1266 family iron-only hydrogenase system putative regulator [uncultured Peptoniphilus sp.]|uniref:TM1266 family iron-only hydrogenase system putative regulator n=1 Tax=uncultured Peptoniphilus sp. TaxID=254354 RepID=UPI0028056152|nr:TM1266 family iron-only hydrogenase system putative regulator [uncultured Peptoniphilus sp.]
MNRIALIGVIVEDYSSVIKLNEFLHEYRDYIIGRQGIPYKARSLNIISIALDAPLDTINALNGKLGSLKGVSSKCIIQ